MGVPVVIQVLSIKQVAMVSGTSKFIAYTEDLSSSESTYLLQPNVSLLEGHK